MLICVLGNIGSGKTTISYALKNYLQEYQLIILDEYRFKFNEKNTHNGEVNAQNQMIKDLEKYKNVILECTGTGKCFREYIFAYSSSFPDEKIKKFKLVVPMNELHKRIKQRTRNGYKKPPFPYSELKAKPITVL